MSEFGIRMSGNESYIEDLLKTYLFNNKEFRYLEIGFGTGLTCRAIYDIVLQNIKHDNYLFYGLELYGGWSIDWNLINKSFKKEEIEVFVNGLSGRCIDSKITKVRFFLEKQPREWIKKLNDKIDIIFIDGEHSQPEVTKDFLAIEDKVKKNGLVLFHDACLLSQGTDYQSLGNEFINVRKALRDLGLLDNKRDGWRFHSENLASRFRGGDGNGIICIQKT